jgi:uncharacterized protein YegP (UPF0339 family)
MRIPEFTIRQRDDGQWYWSLRASNGEPLCHSEGFPTEAGAIRGAKTARRRASLARIVVRNADNKIARTA